MVVRKEGLKMGKIYCPNCGSEVAIPEKSSVGIGVTISKETKGDFALPLEKVRNNNVENYERKTNVEKKENKTMNNNMNGMNGFDMEMLAKMVAAQLKGENVQVQTVAQNTSKVDVSSLNNCETDKNHWAENSQFYGKEICGYAYNPYMIRRFLPAQFIQLMNKYNYNVHKAITVEYPYMYTIKYTLEEVRKLAMLEKRDKIAFDERKYVFTIRQCKKIFVEYLNAVIAELDNEKDKFVYANKVGKEYYCGIKGFGWVKAGVVAEKIVNHKVVKYLETSDAFKNVYNQLRDMITKVERCYYYKDLYKIMSARNLIKVPAEHKKSKDFMDCFIKAGSYYTLKQQLMFNGSVRFKGYYGREAVQTLRDYLRRGTDGYVLYAMLKKVNGIR
jgi:uncharacterized Zn finger protein (UPF0148 family)